MKDPLSILLVDDDPDEHDILLSALNMLNRNCRLISAHSHAELITELEKGMPTAIFLDINIPGINGFEILTWIISDIRYIDLPIVIYSTSPNADHVDKCYKMGADLYFKKETSLSALSQKLDKVLDHIENNKPFTKKDFDNYSYAV